MSVLEFWPDYGPWPRWTDDDKPVDLAKLDVDQAPLERMATWNDAYGEDKPIEVAGSAAWLSGASDSSLKCAMRWTMSTRKL